jgi:hypothetical protein
MPPPEPALRRNAPTPFVVPAVLVVETWPTGIGAAPLYIDIFVTTHKESAHVVRT